MGKSLFPFLLFILFSPPPPLLSSGCENFKRTWPVPSFSLVFFFCSSARFLSESFFFCNEGRGRTFFSLPFIFFSSIVLGDEKGAGGVFFFFFSLNPPFFPSRAAADEWKEATTFFYFLFFSSVRRDAGENYYFHSLFFPLLYFSLLAIKNFKRDWAVLPFFLFSLCWANSGADVGVSTFPLFIYERGKGAFFFPSNVE